MFSIWHKTVTKHKTRTIFIVVVGLWLLWFAWIGGSVHLRKISGGKGWIDFFKYSNTGVWISFQNNVKKWCVNISNKSRVW